MPGFPYERELDWACAAVRSSSGRARPQVRDEPGGEIRTAPVGYGLLDREPLLRERFWLPDPRVSEHGRRDWWAERATLDAGRVIKADIVAEDGRIVVSILPLPAPVGSGWIEMADRGAPTVRLDIEREGRLTAVISAQENSHWFEWYERDQDGRVIVIHESGGRVRPGWSAGPSDPRTLSVSYADGGVVESIRDERDRLVYQRSDLSADTAIERWAERVTSACREALIGAGRPIDRLLLVYSDGYSVWPGLIAITGDVPGSRKARELELAPSVFVDAGLPDFDESIQQVTLAGLAGWEGLPDLATPVLERVAQNLQSGGPSLVRRVDLIPSDELSAVVQHEEWQ